MRVLKWVAIYIWALVWLTIIGTISVHYKATCGRSMTNGDTFKVSISAAIWPVALPAVFIASVILSNEHTDICKD